jgi:hypothetical protein
MLTWESHRDSAADRRRAIFNLAAANICLFIGIIFRDGGVANLIGSLVMLFSLLQKAEEFRPCRNQTRHGVNDDAHDYGRNQPQRNDIIVYPMTGLIPAWPEFFRFLLVLVLFNLAAANIADRRRAS